MHEACERHRSVSRPYSKVRESQGHRWVMTRRLNLEKVARGSKVLGTSNSYGM